MAELIAELKQQIIELQKTLNETSIDRDVAKNKYEGYAQTLKAVQEAAAANPQNTDLQQSVINASAQVKQAGREFTKLDTQYNKQSAELDEVRNVYAATAQVASTSENVDGVNQIVYGRNNTAVSASNNSSPTVPGYISPHDFQPPPPEEQQSIKPESLSPNPLDTGGVSEFGGGPVVAAAQAQNTGTTTTSARNQQSGAGSPKDWRFRISLAPGATYLYKDSSPGILKPLMATNGVIFPYSPQINLSYTASYNATDLVHTNYKVYNYKSSSVENINITGDFTVQDSAEANYVLAVIHFFRSVTKMFYGQDQNPARGVPPPLCYLTGFGQYQFDMHPVAITSFTYTFPNDVDYVNAFPTNNSVSIGGNDMLPYMPQIASFLSPLNRLQSLAGVGKGGLPKKPTFATSQNINEVTRVPAKITIQLSCIPIVSRNTMSNQFSLKQYANGSLLKGTTNFSRTGGGLW